ncbi:MAG: Ig-like domain-containing protein, partial [Leptothrix sp. (in: b-proteobacteria)]
QGGSVTRTITVTVGAINDAPVLIANASTTASQDTPVTGQAPAATDIDGDALVYELATAPGHGSVAIAADGRYVYTPTAGFSGSDRFQARVADGHGGQATVWIDVTVQPAPTLTLAAASDLGVSNTDRVTSAPVITLEGAAQPNQTLHLYSPQGQLLASVTADASGHWRADGIDLTTLQGDSANAAAGAPGTYTFALRPVLNGQEGAAARLNVTREVITPAPEHAPSATAAGAPTTPVTETTPTAAATAQPAFDSALVPRSGTGEALPLAPVQATPVRDAAPAPAPRTATEGDIYTRPSGFQIMVTPSSEPALKLFRGVDDQMIPLGRSVAVQIPADAFVHTVLAETVTLHATQADGTPLPGWLSFDSKSGKFVGEPPAGLAQDVAIRVTARDSQGREATTMFRLTVKDGSTSSRATFTQQLARGEALAFKPGQRVWQAQPRPLARHG